MASLRILCFISMTTNCRPGRRICRGHQHDDLEMFFIHVHVARKLLTTTFPEPTSRRCTAVIKEEMVLSTVRNYYKLDADCMPMTPKTMKEGEEVFAWHSITGTRSWSSDPKVSASRFRIGRPWSRNPGEVSILANDVRQRWRPRGARRLNCKLDDPSEEDVLILPVLKSADNPIRAFYDTNFATGIHQNPEEADF